MAIPEGPDPVRLNIGAGAKRPEGFLSVGLEPEHDVVCDVRSIPLPDGCAEEAMAIHVLEHLDRWDAPAALAEWRRVLKPGGLLILELPDFLKCCAAVLRGAPAREGLLGIWGDPEMRDPLMMHRWGWTVDELKRELRAAGFSKVRERAPQFHGKRTRRDMRLEARA
jgi:SAM-dependent methyltransferase